MVILSVIGAIAGLLYLWEYSHKMRRRRKRRTITRK